jgi:hypothetical protein
MTEQDQYLAKKYDFIPVSAELIEHVRRLDGFNVSSRPIKIWTYFYRRRNWSNLKQ